jgi:hypothetical protein
MRIWRHRTTMRPSPHSIPTSMRHQEGSLKRQGLTGKISPLMKDYMTWTNRRYRSRLRWSSTKMRTSNCRLKSHITMLTLKQTLMPIKVLMLMLQLLREMSQ